MSMYVTTTSVSDVVRDVYKDIRLNISSTDPLIDAVLCTIFAQHGKGIRPLFMTLVGELVGGSWDNLRSAAMVIEAIHIASLIHDDMIDGSVLRHGKETLNAKYSDKVSVLFGDYVFLKAINIACSIGNPEVLSILYRVIERMLEGEMREILCDRFIDEETYYAIIRDKTASLFEASGELGIVLSGLDGIKRTWAHELGESVGMAFQIIDDALDFKGTTGVMGKPRFMDIKSGRITLPVIHALKSLSPGEINNIFDEKADILEKLAPLVKNNGGIEYAYEKAHAYVNRAREILERFENKEVLVIFDGFFDMLMTRTF